MIQEEFCPAKGRQTFQGIELSLDSETLTTIVEQARCPVPQIVVKVQSGGIHDIVSELRELVKELII